MNSNLLKILQNEELNLIEFNRIIVELEDNTPSGAVSYGMDREILLAADGLPVTGYLRLKDVLTLFPVSKSTWYDGIKKGNFPEPIKKFGPKMAFWHIDDIRNLLEK